MEKASLKYENIWKKSLSDGERIEYEFSISSRYRKIYLILWGVISIPFLFGFGLGIVIFLIALFYYGYYLKVANAFAFTNKRVLAHKGWLSTKMISADYSKITDVFVEEPILDKIITHTGHLALNTAGTGIHEIVLKHIENPYEVKKKLDSLRD
ncbi:MAG: PH domain-containing protein [Actinobacteria bacterium]|nr:PH domain-containing protein [Actinomycetota bacterium]